MISRIMSAFLDKDLRFDKNQSLQMTDYAIVGIHLHLCQNTRLEKVNNSSHCIIGFKNEFPLLL